MSNPRNSAPQRVFRPLLASRQLASTPLIAGTALFAGIVRVTGPSAR